MTLEEFCRHYTLHDSVIGNLQYENGELRIYCEFCNFMQENYNENDPKNSDVVITFRNARYSVTDGFIVNEAGFLSQKLNGDTLVFILENGIGTYGELSVKADSVKVDVLRSYSL